MDASKSTVTSPEDRKICALEDRYRNEIMDEEERCELRDRILQSMRKVGRV